MESPTSQGGPQSLPQREFDASIPALVELYAHKPLPPLPLTSRPKRMARSRPRTPRTPTEQRDPSCRPTGSPEPPKPRRATAPSSPRSHPHRISYSGLSATGRCSSHKIQQLTGYDIDVMHDCPASRPSVDSDRSSNYSQKWDGDYSLVPLLEADNGDTSSRGSSWAPTSPQSPLVPAPLNMTKPAIRHGSDSNLAGNYASDAHIALDDELVARRWDPACGHFSDTETAGEYHRIASQLAARLPPHASREASALPASTRRKRLSLSAGFAVARLSRRRNTSHPVDSTVPPQAVGSNKTPHPLEERLASPLSLSPAPVSAFDSDSSDDEKTAGSGIREWFGRKSERHDDDSGTRASTGEHMRGLLHQAKDRARRLHGSNEERRSGELRRRHTKTVSS